MAIQIQGNGGTVAEVGGTTHRALRMEQRPIDHGTLGAYRMSVLSGTMAAALGAGSEVFQFRWSDATRFCAVQRVVLDGLSGSATAFTAGFGKIDMIAARSFTATGSGGSAATLTTNNNKLRTAMATTLLGEARFATTGAIAAGTKVLDSQPMGQISLAFGVSPSVQYANQIMLFGEDPGPTHPLVLAQNEGFSIRATVPATGTWQFGLTVLWTELAAY